MTYEVELISTSELTPYARNARTHTEEQLAQISASIKEFGFNNPVLIDTDSGIIAGHGRVMAAELLGIKELPCIRLKHLTEEKKRAYILADNQIALNAGWNPELLSAELGELQDLDIDLSLLGFSDEELNFIMTDTDVGGEFDNAGTGESLSGNLSSKFMIPPFSILNAREGWWQSRKQQWLALGIKSELGRGSDVTQTDGSIAAKNGAVPGGGGKSAIYRKGPGFSYKNAGKGSPING